MKPSRIIPALLLATAAFTQQPAQPVTAQTSDPGKACPVQSTTDCRACPTVPNPYDACEDTPTTTTLPPWGTDPGNPGQPNGVNCLFTPLHEACPRPPLTPTNTAAQATTEVPAPTTLVPRFTG